MGDKPKPDQEKESTGHKPPPIFNKSEFIVGKDELPLPPKQKPPTDKNKG